MNANIHIIQSTLDSLHTGVVDDPGNDHGSAGNLVSGTCFETLHYTSKVTIDTENC